MARVTYSALLESIRGKVSNAVFQESPAGPILRGRGCFPNSNTLRQNKSRNITANLQAEWIKLTAVQRELWDGYRKYAPTLQRKNSGKFLNGQQAFLKANHNRIEYGLTVLKEPQFNKCDLTPIIVTLRQAGPSLFADFDRVAIPTEEFVMLFVSIPLPASWNNGRSFPKLLKFTTPAAATKDITPEYLALFGKSTVAGDTLFFRFNNADKRSGYQFSFKSDKVTL